ncbi:MAG: 2-hydroxyhepta-2,4-diene-1,7-dioate isomerase [Opitutales bacterium]|nr:2-hydroxyhepta-2,4-diene-1,7-dioate isomerase [Opitutales bacterium]
MSIFLYRTESGLVASRGGSFGFWEGDWDSLFSGADVRNELESFIPDQNESAQIACRDSLLPPIGSQEVWASGVTYYSSRLARMEESKSAGGSDFYAAVYNADRPELFFKSTPERVRGHGQSVRIREDSSWDVPEPELTLAIGSDGSIFGYTIGNDMSSRSIEGENPLYLPQAKTYTGSAGLGPCLCLLGRPIPAETKIRLSIKRSGASAFEGETQLSEIGRLPISGNEFSKRMLFDDGYRHRSRNGFFAAIWRLHIDFHRSAWFACSNSGVKRFLRGKLYS